MASRVVCVNAPRGLPEWPWRAYPVLGKVYTVRGFRNENSLYLEEIKNDIGRSGSECGFDKSRFRPVVETDISIFKAMLNPSLEDLAGHILNEVM